MAEIITSWGRIDPAEFGAVPLELEHTLHEHPLFSQQALERLLERLPRESYYVNTMDTRRHDLRSRREGELGGLSGAQVLEAVARGRIWILLQSPEQVDPGYRDLLDAIYAEMARHVPGLATFQRRMTILISSPGIQVYYHSDVPGQTLWQVRGQKRVYVYPPTEPYLEQASLERIVLGEAHEISLRYEEAFDAGAHVFDLMPGRMLHWPLNAPHRIVNADCVNVSFTTEHFTDEIRRLYHVNSANGVLRRLLPVRRLSQSTRGPAYWAKLGVAAAYKLSGRKARRRQSFKVDFRVDPEAPGAVRDIAPYEFRK